jgi:hypothetical protein
MPTAKRHRLKPGDFAGFLWHDWTVVPFPFVPSLNKVNGSGQECPLHMATLVSYFGNHPHFFP